MGRVRSALSARACVSCAISRNRSHPSQRRRQQSLSTTVMASTKDESVRLIYAPNVVHNSSLNSVKFLSSCFMGAVAGILGLENWQGFALFIVSTLFTAACIYVVNCKGRPAKYIAGGVKELANPGQDNIFSFVLVWTLFFGTSR